MSLLDKELIELHNLLVSKEITAEDIMRETFHVFMKQKIKSDHLLH